MMLKVEAGESHPLIVVGLIELPHLREPDLAQQPCIHIRAQIGRDRRSGEMSHPLNMGALITSRQPPADHGTGQADEQNCQY